MKTPKVGQIVYVGHLSVRDITKPSVKISEREFYRTATPSYAKGALRWVVGPLGESNGHAGYGLAYTPEMVFETREEAQADVNARIDAIVANLTALKA